MPQVLSITQVNEYIRATMDADTLLNHVAVRGEISNYKLYPSGHHYFTLKDENSALKCVLFKGNAFRLRFRPENGMNIIATGKISVYPRDGAYQLYCNSITPDGVGDLHIAFEQLKKKLSEQGLFDEAHKKPLPRFPKKICIITSSAGAAIHDMLRIMRKRYPPVGVCLLPVRVQGAEAPGEIAAAIAYANRYALADLLIVGRGGGSIEDLWAFNDERVARAIYDSEIPVISAVGHEPDVTISDFVADVRAATPSNAAELAVPDRDALLQTLDGYAASMISNLQRQLSQSRRHLQLLSNSSVLQKPESYILQQRKALLALRDLLVSLQTRQLSIMRHRYIAAAAKLDGLSPLKVFVRGYALVRDADNGVVRSVKQVRAGDMLKIAVYDGTITAKTTTVEENVG